MLSAERGELILRVLRQSRFASVADLAGIARSSPATIRRHLARMEDSGLVCRVRGGAELAAEQRGTEQAEEELPFEYRKGIQLEKKRLIARAAAALCADGETVIIDGGSTTFQMAEFLRDCTLQVITNSFAIAHELVRRSRCTVILSGGVVHPDSQLVLDPFAEEMFAHYTASKVFMGVYGIDETGATNTESLLIKTERAMIERARTLIVLADSSKFDRRGSLLLCGFEKIQALITDPGIDARHREMLISRGVRLIVAGQ
jgi:DeoR family ulaG and ulaABCDEF operon transcriptional repressor